MTGAAGTLPVERVCVSILEVPIDDAVPMSFGRLEARQACIVEVTAGGLVGTGESWINYPAWASAERVATLCRGVAPRLIGVDATDPPSALRQLTETLLPIGRQWGAPGPIWQAISGIDIALWDLTAQAIGTSLAAVLAGNDPTSLRTHVPAYASGVGPNDVEALCARAIQSGFGAVKAKVGFGLDTDIATLANARSVLGDDIHLFADANQAWTLTEATEMLQTLIRHGVEWLEEPIDGDSLADLEKLAAAGSVAIATGENIYGVAEFDKYADSGAVSILQPDLAKSGGLTIGGHVARAAGRTRLAPHCYASAIGLAASAQLGAAYPNVEWLEVDIRDNPLRTDLLEEPLNWDSGSLHVPTAPGLGIELNQAFIRRHRTHHEEITANDR